MKKLFHKDQREEPEPQPSTDLNDFFQHTPSADRLSVSHAPPPPAPRARPRLDISNATRYPQALNISQAPQLSLRPASRSPGIATGRKPVPNRRGLLVRFVDTYPEVIGEGGDECPEPTMEISRRKRTRVAPPQPSPRPPAALPPKSQSDMTSLNMASDDFTPKPLKRSQTGYSSIHDPEDDDEPTIQPGNATSARFLGDGARSKDEKRRSFIEIHSAEMREAEGRAFAAAIRTNSGSMEPPRDWEEKQPERQQQHLPQQEQSPHSSVHESPAREARAETPEHQLLFPQQNQSPSSIHSTSSSVYGQVVNPNNLSRQTSIQSQLTPSGLPPNIPSRQTSLITPMEPPPLVIRQGSSSMHDVVQAAGEDCLNTFKLRIRHLFELFRLHAEQVRPLSACSLEALARAGLWWFIKGRMGLEMVIRAQASQPGAPIQQQMEMDRQQAYANLAKGYWLAEEAISEVLETRGLQQSPVVDEARRALGSNLRKLAVSMKRNNMLPPEDALLPQTIERSIWTEYPRLTDDLVALLTHTSGVAMGQRPPPSMTILESFPLGDTGEYFNYSRVAVDAYLSEQGNEAHHLRLPCLLSTIRPQTQPNLIFVLASQNGQVQLRIQGNKNVGPIWDDVRWQHDTNILSIRLPRGFKLDIQCGRQDFAMLLGMYDFGNKVQATLYPRPDEIVMFRSSLPAFEYLDADPQSRVFPKEAQANCEVALFERIQRVPGAAGPRNHHRGCRVAVVTGPRTRTLSGVNHFYAPGQVISFSFLRGANGLPALDLRFDNTRQRGHMVLAFKDENERIEFHTLFTGTKVAHDETIVSQIQLAGFGVSQKLEDKEGVAYIRKMPWGKVQVINDENGGESPPTVLADRLRLSMDFNYGTMTDRVNVETGELKIRLDVDKARVLHVLRQPQQDATMAISEAHISKEMARDLSQFVQVLYRTPTIRLFEFQNAKDLHSFQEALTGYKVLFDCIASSFGITRRRMVVPIHKKWEAGLTRIQVVQQDTVVQMLVFFKDFHHGQCMGFVLKGTDNFETFHRSGKSGLKIVDAKFPLPQGGDDGQTTDEMGFLCLDLPALPGEHDDISILFEKESGTFVKANHAQ